MAFPAPLMREFRAKREREKKGSNLIMIISTSFFTHPFSYFSGGKMSHENFLLKNYIHEKVK